MLLLQLCVSTVQLLLPMCKRHGLCVRCLSGVCAVVLQSMLQPICSYAAANMCVPCVCGCIFVAATILSLSTVLLLLPMSVCRACAVRVPCVCRVCVTCVPCACCCVLTTAATVCKSTVLLLLTMCVYRCFCHVCRCILAVAAIVCVPTVLLSVFVGQLVPTVCRCVLAAAVIMCELASADFRRLASASGFRKVCTWVSKVAQIYWNEKFK